MYLKNVVLLIIFMHSVLSFPFTNTCFEPKAMDKFDVHRFSGKWYEILRVNSTGPVTSKCHSETYAIPDETFVIISAEFIDKETQNISFIEGVAAVHIGKPGNFIYNIPAAKATGVLSVIDTDYETYAALFICNTYEYLKIEHFWILSRERKLSTEIIDKLLAEYKDIGGRISSLIFIDQNNCPQEEHNALERKFRMLVTSLMNNFHPSPQ